MPQTTPLQAITIPVNGDQPTVPAHLLTSMTEAESRFVMRFTTSANRDGTITVPVSGMLAWLSTPKTMTLYDGTAWVNLISQVTSLSVNSVDAVNAGGLVTLKGAGSNKNWSIRSQAQTFVFQYDAAGTTPTDIMTLAQTSVTINPVAATFVRAGVNQPVLRSGAGVPSNATGVDGDWYAQTS